MKKNALIFIFSFICISTVFSQDWFIGGDMTVHYDSVLGSKVGISPEIGYRINNKLDLGLNPLIRALNPISFGIDVFSRYSFFEINKFSILGRLGLGYYNLSNYYLNDREQFINKYQMLRLYISPVFQYKLLDNFSFYSKIGNISFSYEWHSDDSPSNNNFGINITNNISLGFYIFFGSSRRTDNEDDEW